MALFLSTFVNKVDRKGRVSVPATFRSALAEQRLDGQPFQGIVAHRSVMQAAALEGSGVDRLQAFSDEFEALNTDPDERAEFLSLILQDAKLLPWDTEGRIGLPEEFKTYAGIGDDVAFIGQGKFFFLRKPEEARADLERSFEDRRAALLAKRAAK